MLSRCRWARSAALGIPPGWSSFGCYLGPFVLAGCLIGWFCCFVLARLGLVSFRVVSLLVCSSLFLFGCSLAWLLVCRLFVWLIGVLMDSRWSLGRWVSLSDGAGWLVEHVGGRVGWLFAESERLACWFVDSLVDWVVGWLAG